ncbi:MAG: HlyD family efflux transporter periplasmic adaptor subunit [Bacteroidales bacterium]|nr:HlyD family efflux transporter periplasmic adaptor subunit [Bacteroidales bacterium]MDZ4204222.1 HlyD family efflux transporter periplasmic adaptor subunit [Bacteroidales bacterium]
MNGTLNQIEIRSQEIDEILGKAPNSIIRWGITVFFAVIVLLLTGSWFFRYPETIQASIEITTLSPPADIIAKTSGKIESLFVADNQLVTKFQVLATIENPANYIDVLSLINLIDSIELVLNFQESMSLVNPINKMDKRLGELQGYYSLFTTAYNNYLHFIHLDYYPQKIKALEKQVGSYRLFYDYTFSQRKTLEADLGLAEKEHQRYLSLFESKTIPESELETAKSRYLSRKYAFESARTALANVNIQIAQLENNILELQLQQVQQNETLQTQLKEAIVNLKAQIEIWAQRYILKAPIQGKAGFTKIWSENQNVAAGEKVMTIVPENEGLFIGKLLLPVAGAGKVHAGQRVNIKLLSYPYMEFGMLEGVVDKISRLPDENFYYVEVNFPNSLRTNYGIDLVFSQKMQGSAEIVTENIRLLERFVQPLRHIWKRQAVIKD